MSFESDAGIISAEIKNGTKCHPGLVSGSHIVKIKMPLPKNFKLDFDLTAVGQNFNASFINTGVPHTVIFVEDIKKIKVEHLGKAIRWHKEFQPEGTNVNFVKVLAKNKLQVRTYERGVEAETLACGTGVVASSVILIMKKYVSSPVSVLTQGGETLKVYYDGKTAFLEGKVTVVFEGKIEK